MQHVAPIVATFSHIPGQMTGKKVHGLQQEQGKMLQGHGSSGFFRSSTGIQGKFSGKERSEGITAQKSTTRFLGCYTFVNGCADVAKLVREHLEAHAVVVDGGVILM